MSDEPSLTPLESSGYAHGKPPPDFECMATMEDITEEDGNFCEYQTAPSGRWHPALFSADVVRRLVFNQFSEYMAGVRKADCAADLKRRIGKGPPIWVEDKHALPVPEDDTHICRIWMASDGVEYSAKLVGCKEVHRVPAHLLATVAAAFMRQPLHARAHSLRPRAQGEERQQLWDELKNFLGPGGEEEAEKDEAVDGATDELKDASISK